MFGQILVAGAIVACSVTTDAAPTADVASTPVQAAGAQPAVQPSPADLAPFLGEWTLALQGQNGPGTFLLSIRMEKDKGVADIAAETMPKQAIADLSKSGKDLTLGYSFTWEGNPVSAVVSLMPSEDGTVKAQIDFAGGAYIMTGTATKKERPK